MSFILFKIKQVVRKYRHQKRIHHYNLENRCRINIDCNITGEFRNLLVGEDTVINSNCNIRNKNAVVKIGKACLIARNVSIITSNYILNEEKIGKDSKHSSVIIGDNVWIGTNVVIMPGVNIGSGAVIGAQSVVTKNVLPMSINSGIPCKHMSER
jgi:acetyltransferase-like isoleucine patch superfamily enzyme